MPSAKQLLTAASPASRQPHRLLQEHGPVLWSVCRRLAPDPEDAYQDVWEHILARMHLFDASKGSVRTWMLTLTHRLLVDRHRRRRVRGDTRAAVEIEAHQAQPDELAMRRQAHARLERALANLPEGQRRIVVMHHLHGLELHTIATGEGLPIGTVKSRLHRGRALLARQLKRLT